MSTRANIELYDGWWPNQGQNGMTLWKKVVVLYHHCDGYPSWMGPELERILKAARRELHRAGYPYWWDSERVGALMIKLSADSDFYKGVPRFNPCLDFHGDIDYLWRVFLGPYDRRKPKVLKYEIQCFSITHDWEKDVIQHQEPVDWREEVKSQQGR